MPAHDRTRGEEGWENEPERTFPWLTPFLGDPCYDPCYRTIMIRENLALVTLLIGSRH